MPNHAILNNVQHKHLRVIAERGAAWGDALMSALTFPAEFRDLQACYPIIFAMNEAGRFDALALLGFEQGENLFLGPDGWDAPVVPLTMQRQPFLIGRGAGAGGGGAGDEFNDELSVHIDLDSPRVRDGGVEGEALFLAYGGTSEYLEHMASMLRTIHDGMHAAQGFCGALQELDLFEPFVFDVELDSGARHRLAGFYAIHEERLAALTPDQIAGLHRAGWLQPMYMAVASLSQFRALVARKNRMQA